MEKSGSGSIRAKIGMDFKHLPGFSSYLLHHSLDPFVNELFRAYQSVDIPLMRHFAPIGSEEHRTLVTASTREMLVFIASNNIDKYIDESIRSWIGNELPMISREQIHAEDITLINHARATVLRRFIPAYTHEPETRLLLADEIGRFFTIFNAEAFSSYLLLQQEEIRKVNATLTMRERYLEELNKSLESTNLKLSQTNEELESFNFVASHDLQEPLRKIQVYSNRILESGEDTLPSQVRQYFERINAASRRMQTLIEDFLAFAHTFDRSHPPEEIDLNQLIDEIRRELITSIEETNAHITIERLPYVRSLRFHIKQLLTNLLSNALKYTESGVPPEIRIGGSVVPGKDIDLPGANPAMNYVKVWVQDNGIGFHPKYRQKIFELFQRLHSRNAYSGTGIGLALCQKIVRNLGGLIDANSQPGSGATFTFYIPQ